jgi:hypothetical protein
VPNNYESHKEKDIHRAHSCFWHLIHLRRIFSSEHHSNPAFGSHHIEQGPEPLDHVVKVLILIYPVTAEIHAPELIVNCNSVYFRDIAVLAVVEFPFVEIGPQDCKENQEKARHHHHVEDVWDCVDQRLNCNSQSGIP